MKDGTPPWYVALASTYPVEIPSRHVAHSLMGGPDRSSLDWLLYTLDLLFMK